MTCWEYSTDYFGCLCQGNLSTGNGISGLKILRQGFKNEIFTSVSGASFVVTVLLWNTFDTVEDWEIMNGQIEVSDFINRYRFQNSDIIDQLVYIIESPISLLQWRRCKVVRKGCFINKYTRKIMYIEGLTDYQHIALQNSMPKEM